MKKIYAIIIILAFLFPAALFSSELLVAPNPCQIQVNSTVSFSATGLEPGYTVNWQVIPSSLGKIDENGFFTASEKPGQGIIRVIAHKDGQTVLGHALLKITAGRLQLLLVSVTPTNAKVEATKSLRFSSQVRKSDGTILESAVDWKVIPEDLGTIDNQGTFTAKGQGNGRIVAVAHDNDQRGLGQTAVSVFSSGKNQKLTVIISPQRTQLKIKETAVFSAQVTDSAGNPVSAQLKYTVSPNWLGTVDRSGNFIAGEKPGLGVVKVEAISNKAYGSNRAFVITAGQAIKYQVKIKPRQAVLEPKSITQLQPEAYDQAGNQVYPSSWKWKVIPEELGSITPQGLFTAGDKPISGKIVAQLPETFGQGQDVVSIKVTSHSRNIIKISPPKTNLKPGQMVQFSANIANSQGRPLQDARIIWKVTPDNLGQITPQGLFTAGPLPKAGAVIAEIAPEFGGGRALSPVIISSYTVKITTTNLYNIQPGDDVTFTAAVRDASGNSPTNLRFEWSVKSTVAGFGTFIDPDAGRFEAGLNPAKLPADGYIMVQAFIGSQSLGRDGIKITIR